VAIAVGKLGIARGPAGSRQRGWSAVPPGRRFGFRGSQAILGSGLGAVDSGSVCHMDRSSNYYGP